MNLQMKQPINFEIDKDADFVILRYQTSRTGTNGILFQNNNKGSLKMICYTLEDRIRHKRKVMGDTAIWVGKYPLNFRQEGGFYQRYKKRFESIEGEHHGMIEIAEVRDFKYILFHCGNDNEDTRGCVLLGSQPNSIHTPPLIADSVKAYKKAYVILRKVLLENMGYNKKTYIQIIELIPPLNEQNYPKE